MLRRIAVTLFVLVIAASTKADRVYAAASGCGFDQVCVDNCPVSPLEACESRQPMCIVTDAQCAVDDFDCGSGWLLQCVSSVY